MEENHEFVLDIGAWEDVKKSVACVELARHQPGVCWGKDAPLKIKAKFRIKLRLTKL